MISANTNANVSSSSIASAVSIPSLSLSLEKNSKWYCLVSRFSIIFRAVLEQILDEIENEAERMKCEVSLENLNSVGPTLICARDVATVASIQNLIEFGAESLLKRSWKNFLISRRLQNHPLGG